MSGKRSKLHQHIPLAVPYAVQIFPIYACNLRCEYCIHSLPVERRGFISECTSMDLNLYKKAIDDLSHFGQKIKMLRFAAMGEPLLHPQIAEMVQYAKLKNIAESVEIVTNGVLLTSELSLSLIDAGLDRLRISLEGLSSEAYLEHCNRSIDYNLFYKNLEYFYFNKRNTSVYIKIIDYMLHSEDDERNFFQSFSPISDEIAIEHLTPTIDQIDYHAIDDHTDFTLSQNGIALTDAKICPMPFYFMQINPDGAVVPCCSTKYPTIFGNIKEDTVKNIWNGQAFRQFRYQMLSGTHSVCSTCGQCNLYLYGLNPEDYLDPYADVLREKLNTLEKV